MQRDNTREGQICRQDGLNVIARIIAVKLLHNSTLKCHTGSRPEGIMFLPRVLLSSEIDEDSNETRCHLQFHVSSLSLY